ncbi:MAG: hypothetical protein DMG39_18580 [Acidobacteria bacterium]|nr:MAG: hypothetical protein DMG39_18580 [Acidobacteriota bacterium]
MVHELIHAIAISPPAAVPKKAGWSTLPNNGAATGAAVPVADAMATAMTWKLWTITSGET